MHKLVRFALQLKSGELRSSASVGAELIKTQQPIEVQVLGYGLLQHLVSAAWLFALHHPHGKPRLFPARASPRPPGSTAHAHSVHPGHQGTQPSPHALQVGNRWEEFTAEEQSQLATLSYAMLKEGTGAQRVQQAAHVSTLVPGNAPRAPCCRWLAPAPPLCW